METELEFKNLGQLEGEALTEYIFEDDKLVLLFGKYYTIITVQSEYDSEWSEVLEGNQTESHTLGEALRIRIGLTTQKEIDDEKEKARQARERNIEKYERQSYERLRKKFDPTYIKDDEPVERS